MADGDTSKVTESDGDLLREMEEMISTFYPEAYAALREIYKASSANIPYYRYGMVARFIRCNFANLDHVPDITCDGRMNLESVSCPLRGECRHDGIVCRPSFASRMSAAEIRVMGLLYEGLKEDERWRGFTFRRRRTPAMSESGLRHRSWEAHSVRSSLRGPD